MNTNRFAKFLLPMWVAMTAVPAMAVDEMWTGVGSTCTIDEASIALAETHAARLYFKAGQSGIIVARCNVTNPQDDGGNPQWKHLEVGYRDNDGRLSRSPGVKAILYKVHSRRTPEPKGSGGNSEVAKFDSFDYNENGDTVNNAEIDHVFDFDKYTYFVELQIRRDVAVAGINVSVSAIRLW